jgi:predicted N-acetyltransferase YhbS
MRLEYLADHSELAPLLAAWHHHEWAALMPEWSLEQAVAELRGHTGRRQIPTTFVALESGDLLGSASLLAADLPGWGHLSPWLASVFVVPERRGQGIGKRLVVRAVVEARELGVPTVYLFTAGQKAYYERLGWTVLERTRHHQAVVAIMELRTGAG